MQHTHMMKLYVDYKPNTCKEYLLSLEKVLF